MIVAKFRRKSRDRNDKQSLSLKSDYSCNSVKRDYKAICNTPSHWDWEISWIERLRFIRSVDLFTRSCMSYIVLA